MFPTKLLIAGLATFTVFVSAQQSPSAPQQPPVKVNVLNVCSPSTEEQKELSAALAKVPGKPVFGADYEVARGHSTLDPNTPMTGTQAAPSNVSATANWVRVRREFPAGTPFTTVQYSFSVDAENMVETLVLRLRDPKDLMEVSIEDSASSVTSASTMLSAETPASRVKLERFGKSPVVLARCTSAEGKPTDQSAYEPIFRTATGILNSYRGALGVRRMVPQELAHLGVGASTKSAAKKKAP